jgi:hypothetical protein
MMNPNDFPLLAKDRESGMSGLRKASLQGFAAKLAKKSRAGGMSDCQAMIQIFQKAAVQVCGGAAPAARMVDDLTAVLIGDGLRNSERNTGPYALPFQAFLDSGFKAEYKDGGNQVQHAMAGILTGYRGRLPSWAAQILEDEAPDQGLYDVTIPLGRSLTDKNYLTLHVRVETKLASSPTTYVKDQWGAGQGFGR